MDYTKIIQSLDIEENLKILNLTNEKINKINVSILNELNLPIDVVKSYTNKLKGYKYIDDFTELKPGTFIRCIPITKDNNFSLSQSSIVCDTIITSEGVNVRIKTFYNKNYSLNLEEYLVFQKLTKDEQIILYALDNIND